MEKINLDFSKLNLTKVRDDVNLILFNSNLAGIEELKHTNVLIERLRNVKLQIIIN